MKCVAKGVYPIDTGKVKIGAMYLPKRHQYSTEAELFWQGVILGKPTSVTLASRRFINVLRALRSVFRRK